MYFGFQSILFVFLLKLFLFWPLGISFTGVSIFDIYLPLPFWCFCFLLVFSYLLAVNVIILHISCPGLTSAIWLRFPGYCYWNGVQSHSICMLMAYGMPFFLGSFSWQIKEIYVHTSQSYTHTYTSICNNLYLY